MAHLIGGRRGREGAAGVFSRHPGGNRIVRNFGNMIGRIDEEVACERNAQAQDEGEDALAERDDPPGDKAGEGGDAAFEGGLHEVEVLAVALEAEDDPASDEEEGGGDAEAADEDLPEHTLGHHVLLSNSEVWWEDGRSRFQKSSHGG
jgi:hypothetical protein